MFRILNTLLNRIWPVPFPRADEPRMPESVAEAERVYRRYDSLNGRYYFVADVVLDGGKFLRRVTFDGDSRIAVTYDGRPVHQQSDLIGKSALAYLVLEDRSCGRHLGEASEEQKKRFLVEHGVPDA